MQRIPTLYGFSIIILVLILMILNHIIYMEILERSMRAEEVNYYPTYEVKPKVNKPEVSEEDSEGAENEVGVDEITEDLEVENTSEAEVSED